MQRKWNYRIVSSYNTSNTSVTASTSTVYSRGPVSLVSSVEQFYYTTKHLIY